MSWNVTYHADDHYVEMRLEGVLSADELTDAIEATVTAVADNHCPRVLGDCLLLRGGHNLIDLYMKADELARSGKALGVREALIEPESADSAEHTGFWRTLANTRGMTVQTFPDQRRALAWLLRDAEATQSRTDAGS